MWEFVAWRSGDIYVLLRLTTISFHACVLVSGGLVLRKHITLALICFRVVVSAASG